MKKFLQKNNYLYTFIGFVLFIMLWQFSAAYFKSEIILPYPLDILKKILQMLIQKEFYMNLFATLFRWFVAFFISSISGIVLGYIAGFNKKFESFFSIYVSAIKSMPVVSIILLALIWFKSPFVPVFIGILVCFPIMYSNSKDSINNFDEKLVQLSDCYNIKFINRIKDMYILSSLPYFFNGFYLSIGMGLKAILAAEVLSQPKKGIGSQMQIARLYLLTKDVLAYTFIAVLLIFLIDKIIEVLKKRTIKWKKIA